MGWAERRRCKPYLAPAPGLAHVPFLLPGYCAGPVSSSMPWTFAVAAALPLSPAPPRWAPLASSTCTATASPRTRGHGPPYSFVAAAECGAGAGAPGHPRCSARRATPDPPVAPSHPSLSCSFEEPGGDAGEVFSRRFPSLPVPDPSAPPPTMNADEYSSRVEGRGFGVWAI